MDLPFSTEELARLYRFALLLTGDEAASQQVLHDSCVDCSGRLGSYRNSESRLACIIGVIRQKARARPAGEAHGVGRALEVLPEEERSALAGLYCGLLPARALAEAMKMSLDQLGRVLKSARERLDPDLRVSTEPDLEKTA